MKRTKEQPSILGLILIVTGMILLSTLLLILSGRGNLAAENGRIMIGMAGAAVLALGAGAALSARGHK